MAAKKKNKKKVEIDRDLLERMKNQLHLQNRPHQAEAVGYHVGYSITQLFAGLLNPTIGIPQLAGAGEGFFRGARNGGECVRAIYLEAKEKTRAKDIQRLEQKLEKLKATQSQTGISEEELALASELEELGQEMVKVTP